MLNECNRLFTATIVYNQKAKEPDVRAELKKRLFFWKRNKSRLENLPAEQLRHIMAESDHILSSSGFNTRSTQT